MVTTQTKVNPPDPPLAVVATESSCPWSAEHVEVQNEGAVSSMFVSDRSG